MRSLPRSKPPKLLLGATLLVVGATACTERTEERTPSRESSTRPFLWRIEGDVPHYLFGTFHVTDPRVTALPPVVERALAAADVVVTELTMDDLQGAQSAMVLPAGQRLADLVAPETYRRLSAYLARHGVPEQVFENQKVWGAMRVLLAAAMTELAPPGTPALDQVIWNRARDLGVELGALETMAEQTRALDGFSVADQEIMLKGTLDLLEVGGPSHLEQMVAIYVAGDADALVQFARAHSGITDHPRLEREFEQRLIVDRNERMAERIAERLRSRPDATHFFAVGALHYPDPHGILTLLRARGHRITRVEP